MPNCVILLVLIALALSACGLARDIEADKKMRADMVALRAETAACDQRPTLRGKVECVNNAENQYLRPYVTHQDLLNLGQANRLSLAGKVERHEIRPDDAVLELAKVNSAITSELQRRNTSLRSVQAQEANAAANQAAASRTVTCTNLGMGTVTCN